MIELLTQKISYLKILAIDCSGDPGFFGLPAWYRGLNPQADLDADGLVQTESCNVVLGDLTDIWQIAINIIEMITRLSAYIAVIMIIFGGFTFIFANGEPERIATARKTITYAVIGLVIAVFATTIVSYIAGLI